jgi:hypothetical protein
MRARTWLVLGATCMGAVYTALATVAIVRQDIHALLICADQGGLKVPFSRSLCRQYLFSFRGTAQDIAALHEGVGVSFVLQGRSPPADRERILSFLVDKGLDPNHIDMHRLTPLHAAVVANSVQEVELLLRHGARPDVKDERYGLTPLELALTLERDERRQVGREAVIAALRRTR